MRAIVLVLAFLVVVAIPRAAQANLNSKSDDLGNIVVKTSAPAVVMLSSTSNTSVGSVVKDPTCTSFDLAYSGASPPLPTTVLNGQSITFDFLFTPQTRGMQSCQFDVLNGAGTATVGTITLTGTGVAPVSNVTPDNGPPLNFGSVQVGQNDTFNVTIGNTTSDAGQNLHFVSALTLSGTNPSDYTITSANPPADVPLGMATVVAIQFHPTAVGTRTATLNIATNDPLNSPQTIALTGIGTPNASISVSPTTFTYPNVTAGSTSNTTIAVNNVGTAGNLSLSGASITGGAGWFVFTNSPAGNPSCANAGSCTFIPGIAVAPGNHQNVTVQCAPPIDTTGTQMATLTIASDSTTARRQHRDAHVHRGQAGHLDLDAQRDVRQRPRRNALGQQHAGHRQRRAARR